MKRVRTGLSVWMVVLLCGGGAWAAVPEALHFSGAIDTGPTPLTGTASVTFTLYTDPTSTGSDVWTNTETLSVTDGRFHTQLSGVTNSILAGGTLFLGVQVESDPEMSPRIALLSVPFARQADNALTLDGQAPSAFALTAHNHDPSSLQNPGCTSGQLLSWNGTTWACADNNHLTLLDVENDGFVRLSDLATVASTGHFNDLVGIPPCQGGELLEFDGAAWQCVAHAGNPNAHHSSTSAGIAIEPSSVTIQGSSTKLTNGSLDLGPDTDDELTAAMTKTLTGGGDADALHTHAGAGGGGGSCYKSWGTWDCMGGFSMSYEGYTVNAVNTVANIAAGPQNEPGKYGGPTISDVGGLLCIEKSNILFTKQYSTGSYWYLVWNWAAVLHSDGSALITRDPNPNGEPLKCTTCCK